MSKFLKTASPKVTLNQMAGYQLARKAAERFYAKVIPGPNDCQDWGGTTDKMGYGKICVLEISRYLKAHRLSWVLANGPIPKDRPVIRHICDRPVCVNPKHLICGTQVQNVRDAVIKGRNSAGRFEGHRKAKLTWQQVNEIRQRRSAGEACAALGREFGVGRDQVSRICNYKVWVPISSGRRSNNRVIAGSR